MLKILRNKKTAKKIWLALAAIIVPAFVLWGSGSLIGNKEESGDIGRIFGRNISILEFKDTLEAVRNQAIMQFGDKFSDVQKELNLESQAWERLLLLEEAKKRRIKVTDQEVAVLVSSYPFFQKKGQFDNGIYTQMLQFVFHTQPRAFEEQTRQNLMLARLYGQITKDVIVSAAETREAYEKENAQVNVAYIAGLYSDFAKDIAISEEETNNYFAQNSIQFKQPLSYNLEYAVLFSEDNEKAVMEEKINKIIQRLISKKDDFSKIAAEFDLDIKETGLFGENGPIPGIGWSPEIINLLSRAKTGEFLQPALIDKNYYILRLKEKKEPYIPDFKEIEEKVKQAVAAEKSQEIVQKKMEDCLKKLTDAYKVNPVEADFNKIAKEYGLKTDTSGLFKFGSYIEGIGGSDNFWLAARELKENEFSQIIKMPPGLYIIKAQSRQPIDEKKFSEENAEFTKKVLSQKQQEYFVQFFGELRKKAQF